jgi:hypothetical protein
MKNDSDIQVCAVYMDGSVRIYGAVPKLPRVGLRPFIETKQFSTYGKALQFAQDFEEKQKLWGV